MAMLIFRILLLMILFLSTACTNDIGAKSKTTKQEAKETIKVYKDTDLYNTNEAKEYVRLGMINLKKVYMHGNIKKIIVEFQDYYTHGISIYKFKKNGLQEVIKKKTWDDNKTNIIKCYYKNGSVEGCTKKDFGLMIEDANRYQKYH